MTAAAFWRWFLRREREFSSLQIGKEIFLTELQGILARYRPGLGVEISDPEGGVRDLVITAHGDVSLFAAVEELARVAPELFGWRVLALRPPQGFEFEIDSGEGTHIVPSELWFEPLQQAKAPGAVGIRVFIPPSLIGDHTKALVALALRVAIGERVAATQIHHLEIAPMPASAQDYIPLPQLGEYLAWVRNQIE